VISVPDKDPDIRIAIQHSIKVIGWWTAGLYGVVALALIIALVYAGVQRNRLEEVATSTADALCTFRADLQARYDNGIKFLVDHPDGIPGIPVEVLQQTLENQRKTLRSLKDLPCEGDEGTQVLGAVRRPLRDGFIRAVNRARVDKGCRELKPTGKYLNRSARRHSKAMANQDRLFHSQLVVGNWSKVGEVVGVGASWQTIFFALMESRPHRRILLDCAYDRIAVGIITRDRTWLTARFYAK
jgi:hypothetical protein